MIYNHLVDTGIDKRRFEILRSGPTNELRIQFWLSPDHKVKPPTVEPDYDFTIPPGTKPFIAFGREGDECPVSFENNSKEFTELLSANPGAKGKIVIHGPSGAAFLRKKQFVEDALPDIPSSRLTFFFVTDRTIKEEFTWAEYWIVPKREK